MVCQLVTLLTYVISMQKIGMNGELLSVRGCLEAIRQDVEVGWVGDGEWMNISYNTEDEFRAALF